MARPLTAAIAANACLGFLEPTSSGLGGDCYIMLWDPKQSKVVGLAGSGRSPQGLSLETVRARSPGGTLPHIGAVTVSTPGALDAWWEPAPAPTASCRGRSCSPPAIHLCETGVPVPQVIGYYIKRNMKAFVRPGSSVEETANAAHVYAPGGHAPSEGDVFRNPDLAKTYRMIAVGGRDAFYEGPIAHAIDAYFKRIGGWLAYDDLKRQHAEWNTPLVTTYRGVQVYGMAANTQGAAHPADAEHDRDFRHARRRLPVAPVDPPAGRRPAKRLAYEDRARYYADPDFSRVPFEWLTSKALRRRARQPDPPRPYPHPGLSPARPPSHGDTTYFTTSDADGLMISMIQSNFRGMGSGLVADAPGRPCRLEDAGFHVPGPGRAFLAATGPPEPVCAGQTAVPDHHPGLRHPGRRALDELRGHGRRHCSRWARPRSSSNRVDYGLDIQAAGDSPRWHHEGSSQSMGEDQPHLGALGVLRLEDRRAGGDAGGADRHGVGPWASPTAASAATNASSTA